MKLIFLSETNLRDNLFIKDLVHNYKLKEKALMIHDTFGNSLRDTRFVTKRISSLLSEMMVYNNAFMAEQRNLFSRDAGGILRPNQKQIDQYLSIVPLLLVGPVIKNGDESILADPVEMIESARRNLPIEETIVFTDNPMSPLGAKNEQIKSDEDRDRLLSIFEEEKSSLDRAYQLRPARLSSPMTFAK